MSSAMADRTQAWKHSRNTQRRKSKARNTQKPKVLSGKHLDTQISCSDPDKPVKTMGDRSVHAARCGGAWCNEMTYTYTGAVLQ